MTPTHHDAVEYEKLRTDQLEVALTPYSKVVAELLQRSYSINRIPTRTDSRINNFTAPYCGKQQPFFKRSKTRVSIDERLVCAQFCRRHLGKFDTS